MPDSESADAARLAALRAGDERAFASLVDELSPRMLKLARAYLTRAALAEEAVQEAWIVVLETFDRIEGRSSLSTWILGIVLNVARARGRHESRSRPFSSVSTGDEPIIDPDRFLPPDHERWPGHCPRKPATRSDLPTLTIACSCTGPARRSAPPSRRRSTPGRLLHERDGLQGAGRGDHRLP